VVVVILCVAKAMIYETRLPYLKSKMNFPFRAIGETPLDELQCFFQQDVRSRRQQKMEVMGHDDKVMQEKAPLLTILRQNIHQQLCYAIGLEKRAASGCCRGYEKCTL
jgi:hypothetical protein